MGTTRMGYLALRLALVVMAACAGWFSLAPQSAFGFVGSVIVLDSSADPTDHFFDNEPILAGVSVDPFGGRICIVSASAVFGNPGDGSLSCDGAAWGRPQFASGIGFYIFELEPAPLKPGVWRLLGDNQPGRSDALSEPFTVEPCRDGGLIQCGQLIQPAMDLLKASMGFLEQSAQLSCQLATVLTKGLAAVSAYKVARPLAGFVYAQGGWLGVGFSLSTIGAAATAAFVVADNVPNPTDPRDAATFALQLGACKIRDASEGIVNDPPDPNFGSVAAPDFLEIPAIGNPTFDELGSSLDATQGYADALLTAHERWLGAVEAGVVQAQHDQMVAASGYAADLRHAVTDAAESLRSYALYLDATFDVAATTLSTGSREVALSFQQRVASVGFADEERQALLDAGLTEAEIAGVRSFIVSNDISDVPEDLPLQGVLRDMAADLDATVDAIDGYERAAAAEAGRAVGGATNRLPVAVADTGETVGATPATIDVLANDTDPDGDQLTVTGTRDVFRGTASCTPSGNCTYTPNPDFTFGEGSFVYEITDGHGGTASANVRITIRSTRPTAAFTAAPTEGFRSVTVTFDASASSDANGSIESYRWEFGDGETATGAIVEHTYTERGTYNAFLTVTDDDGETGRTGRQIFVTTEQDLELPICGDADGSEVPFQRPCPAPFAYTEDVQLFRVPGTGLVDVRFDFVNRAAALANELVAVRVDDGSGRIDGLLPGEEGYMVLALERAQVVFPGGSGAATPDVTMRFTGGDFLVFGIAQTSLAQLRLNNPSNSAVPGNSAFFSLIALNPDGIQHMVGWEQRTGGFVQFSFEDILGGGDFDYDDITWNVYGLQPLAPESPVGPESTDDTLVTGEDTAGQKDVLANDAGLSLTVTAFTQGAHGRVSCTPAGVCTYMPEPGYSGPDSFTYTASNADGNDTATVDVTVNPVNDPPAAVDDSASTLQGVAKDVNVLANDSDPDGDVLSVVSNSQGVNGSASCTAGAICTYTPNAGYSGPDSFTYTVSDGHGGTATATVGVTVTPVSQVGVSGKGVFNTAGNGKVTFTLSSASVKLAQSSGRKFTFDGTVASVVGGAGTATMTGSGKWNGASGYTFEIRVVDKGSPGYRKGDTITVVIRNPSGAPVFSWGPERLKTGDIRVAGGAAT